MKIATLNIIEYGSQNAIFELVIPDHKSALISIPRSCPVISESELIRAARLANEILELNNLNYNLKIKELEYGILSQ